MAIVPDFPPSLLHRARAVSWRLAASTVSPGQSLAGSMQRGRLDGGGLWVASYTDIPLTTADNVRAWRALEVICDSGSSPVIVSLCDKRHFPAPVIDGKPLYSYGTIPHSDGALFSDGSGYYQKVVDGFAVSPVAEGATSMQIAFNSASELRGGEYFSVQHPNMNWHIYKIGPVDFDGVASTVSFLPPAREAFAALTELEFDRPRCIMTLESPNGMDLDLVMGRRGNASVSFVEWSG